MIFDLSSEEGIVLIKLARAAVEQKIKHDIKIDVPSDIPSKLSELLGAFVTIYTLINGKKILRGCIGYPNPFFPLTQAIIEAAINAATQDPRFKPLMLNELEQTIFEISVLTRPELVVVESPKDYPSEIKIGKDGLIIETAFSKGLLLPQVAVEFNWDSYEFLSQCCMKAGEFPDCWILKGSKIYKFSCILIQEKEPKGSVKIVDMRKDDMMVNL